MPRKRLTSTKKKLLRLGIKTAFETLATAFVSAAAMHDEGRIFRKSAMNHWKQLGYDLESIYNCLWRLKHFGYIEEFVEGKTGYMELTQKGRVRFARYGLSRNFFHPKRWDGKWRVLIYDVPKRLRQDRDRLRIHLRAIGFIPLQESVYIFPYDAKSEVNDILAYLKLKGRGVLLLAETLEGEDQLIAECIEQGILTKAQINALSR